MNEERIQACIKLIQQLVSCPSQEAEAQIINQYRELIDAGFLQVCELFAQQYIDAGRKNEAEFILNRVQ